MTWDLPHSSNVRQGKTPQGERLDRKRLITICLKFRLPNDVMEFVPLFPNYPSYTTTWDSCQIAVLFRQRKVDF